VTKQITPAHVRRAIEQVKDTTPSRQPPCSVLKQILAKLPDKSLDLAFVVRRRARV